MHIIGVTGSFGSGKTTVAKLLQRKGSRLLNADTIAHAALAPRGACFKRVVRFFGREIVRQGRIDRSRLGKIAFDNPRDLKKLCQVVHPQVTKEIQRVIDKNKGQKGFLVLDVPLLFEAGLDQICDDVVVVRADRPSQIRRVQRKSRLKQSEILKRIKAQMPIQQKIKKADFVIDNRKTLNQTKRQVEDLWQKLKTKTMTK